MKQYQSEQINELAAALCKAQGEFPKIPKNKIVDFTNDRGKRTNYKYADLADVIDAIRPILTKYGLAYSQDFREDDHGRVLLWTILMHTSGQWKGGAFPVALGNRQQETGANITYIRRYTLCSALGIQSEEDNDGQFLEDKGNNKGGDSKPPQGSKWVMNIEKLEALASLSRDAGWSKDTLLGLYRKHGYEPKRSMLLQMTQSKYDTIYQVLWQAAKAKNEMDGTWEDFK
jgi:N-acetyl-anhydromuramyl-L-alanine amidase AmpD